MLIVEGSDLVGKTTFCQRALKLARERYDLPCVYSHFSKLPPTWDYYADYLPYITPRGVMDRFCLSEVVYSEVLGRGTNIDDGIGRLLQAHLDLAGSFTVVLTQPPEVLQGRWREGEMFKQEQVLAVNWTFRNMATYVRGLRVDRNINAWDDNTVEEVVHEWVGRLNVVRALRFEATDLLRLRS